MRKTFSLPVAATAAGGGVTPPPADTVDNIEHSVRFNSADSAYLSRTPSSAGDSQKWTFSAWVKRTTGGDQRIFGTYTGGSYVGWELSFTSNDQLYIHYYTGSAYTHYLTSAAKYRDFSAWYHIVVAVDTTQATASDRLKLYVNGSQVTDFQSSAYGSQNDSTNINTTVEHRIGLNYAYGNFLLADVQFLDGYQKAASDFGFTDSTGVWQPKAYTGDYNGPDINGATSPYVFPSSDPNATYNSISSVNSNSGNYAAPVTGGGSIKVKFASTQNNVTSISFRGGDWYVNGLYDVYVNGTKVVNQASTTAAWSEVTHNISSTNIDEIEIRGAGGWSLAGLKFNGTLVSGTPSRGTSSYNGFHLDFADTSSATALGNDVSGNNNDWTPSGLVAGPAYTANSFSTEFDGIGDYIDVASSADFNFGTGEFTVECWYYSPTASDGSNQEIIHTHDAATNNQLSLRVKYNLFLAFFHGGTPTLNSGAYVNNNQWHHLAVTRDSGGTARAFVDGVQRASGDWSTVDITNAGSAGAPRIGFGVNGKVSNLRAIKGRALYTAAFTPPSTALTATDDTVLLTCQDATVRDNSNIGHDVTASGDVAVVNQGPFNGYSGEFDGTGDGLATPNITLGSNDYTLEFWVYLTATGTSRALYGHVLGNTVDRAISYWLDASDQFGFQHRLSDGSYITLSGSTSLKANTWYHLAAVRVNDDYYLYVNGVLDSSYTTAGANHTYFKDPAPHYIGYNRTGLADFLGYISNVRLTVGQALYTGNFTPPTADLTTTSQGATASNVKLLTCQNSTFIDNSPSAHTITANGDASTISVNPHTDKYSVSFPSQGNNIVCTPPNLTGAFNIELWVKGTGSEIFGNWGTGIFLRYGSGSVLQFYSNVISLAASSASNRVGWHHLAVSRDSSNVVRLFEDGKLIDSGTASGTIIMTNLTIGQERSNNGSIIGNISNFRIVDGQALYTSNFLPPTEDLTTTSQGATASNVTLLTCQSYKIQDNSPSPLTLTVNGTAAPSTDAPFVTSGAGSFDGTGDYLTTANHASDFNLGTDDFTIEFWVNTTGTARTDVINWNYSFSSAGWADLIFNLGGSGSIDLFEGSSTARISATSTGINNGLWHHLAVSRSGTSVKMFLDGAQIGSTGTSSYSYGAANSGLIVGALVGGSNVFNGKISNLRISKGLARYTANFTPPTEDFDPTDQDTTFLALQGNTLDDLAGDHAVTANGDAATTTVSPFEPVDGSDAMLDSPTNYGSGDTVRGNYCTLNPLQKGNNATLLNGNLEATLSAAPSAVIGTIGVSSGKWYWEFASTYENWYVVGIASTLAITQANGFTSSALWTNSNNVYGYQIRSPYGRINGSSSSYGSVTSAGDVIGVALDLDNGDLEFFVNGVSQGILVSGLSGTFLPFFENYSIQSLGGGKVNFGQQPFKYPLAGYKSLCSTNLPTPAIADGSTEMDVVTYTGNGSTQTISGLEFSPDLVWIKVRSPIGYGHRLTDTVRGATLALRSHNNTEEITETTGLTAFTSDGFSLGAQGDYNLNTAPIVAWTWDAGSSTVSNTDGTITSQVRANPTAGVSIISWTGTGVGASVGHGLNKVPGMVIIKDRDNTGNPNPAWLVWHTGLGTKYTYWNNSSSLLTASSTTRGGLGVPTSTTVTLTSGSTDAYTPNMIGNDYIGYVFAPVEGFSSFGSYTGSTSGTFVYTGMRPRWLMIKRTDTTSDWVILDTEREGYNVDNDPLWSNLSIQEGTTDIADILSNGFKMRDGATGDYIYAAFAEHPFKTSRAR